MRHFALLVNDATYGKNRNRKENSSDGKATKGTKHDTFA